MHVIVPAAGAASTTEAAKAKAPTAGWRWHPVCTVDDVAGADAAGLGFEFYGLGILAAVIGGAEHGVAGAFAAGALGGDTIHARDDDGSGVFCAGDGGVVVVFGRSTGAASEE